MYINYKSFLTSFLLIIFISHDVVLAKPKIAVVPAHGRVIKITNGSPMWEHQRPEVFDGVIEDNITPKFAKYLVEELDAKGYPVTVSRSLDSVGLVTLEKKSNNVNNWEKASKYHLESTGRYNLCTWNEATTPTEKNKDINSRFRFADEDGADFIINIHTNGISEIGTESQKGLSGTLVLYHELNNHKGISQSLATNIAEQIKTRIEGKFVEKWNSASRMTNNTKHGEIRHASIPAVLVEVAFHDKEFPDADLLKRDDFHREVAQAIRMGIEQFLSSNSLSPKEGVLRVPQGEGPLVFAGDYKEQEEIKLGQVKKYCLLRPRDRDLLEFTPKESKPIVANFIGLPIGTSISILDESRTEVFETEIKSKFFESIELNEIDSNKTYYIAINYPQKEFSTDLVYSVGLNYLEQCLLSKTGPVQGAKFVDLGSAGEACLPELATPLLTYPFGGIDGITPSFRWNSVSGATKYELNIYEINGTSSSHVFPKLDITTNKFTLSAGYLEKGKSYSWNVRAVDADGNQSDYSNKLYFQINLDKPDPVSSLRPPIISYPGSILPYDLNSTTPYFYWQSVSEAAKYALFISDSKNKVVYQNTNILSTRNTLFLPPDRLKDGGRYHWYMVSLDDDNNWSGISNILYFNVKLPKVEEPDLGFARYEIDDNDSGDGDKRAEGGEEIELDVYLKNTGSSDANNLEGILSENSSCVHVRKNRIEISSINAGKTEKLNDFIVEINHCPDGTIVPFSLNIESDEGSWIEQFTLPVFDNSISLADINYSSHLIEDDDSDYGNSDGLANAGETFDLKINLINEGQEKANSVKLTPVSGSDCVVVQSEPITWGFISEGYTKPFPYKVHVDGNCQPQKVRFELDIESEKSKWNDTFELQIYANDNRPDLGFVGSPILATTTVNERSLIDVSVGIKNFGDLISESTVLSYYLSKDQNIDQEDFEFDSDEEGPLRPNQTKNRSEKFRALIEPGDYYVGACLDVVSGEQNISNNCSEGVPITIRDIAGVDIEIWSVTVDESFTYTTSDVSFSSRAYFQNIGDKYTGSDGMRSVYVSKSTPSTSQEHLFRQKAENNFDLEPNQGDDFGSDHLPITEEGTYWVTYCIEQTELEENTDNNCLSKSFEVRLPSYDLAMTEPLSLNITNPNPGQLIRVEAFGENLGRDKSSETTMDYYLSEDEVVDFSDSKLGSADIPRKKNGFSFSPSIQFNAPLEKKQYWLMACIIPSSYETTTENNCSEVKYFYVGEAPEPSTPEDDDSFCFPVIAENRKVTLVCL